LIRQVIRSLGDENQAPPHAPGWKKDMVAHLALFQRASLTQHRYSIFSGNSRLPYDIGPQNAKLSIGSCFLAVPWKKDGLRWPRKLRKEAKCSGYLTMPRSTALHHQAPRWSQSLPAAEGAWGISSSAAPKDERRAGAYMPFVAFFPLKPLSELDKLSRRRSLSRSHIRAMFTDKPEWIVGKDTISGDEPQTRLRHACANCAQYTHLTKNCPSNCGWCNSSEHKASRCTLKLTNRCKCRPFPQYHRSSECHVHCSRRCGSPYPPGNFKHKSAMRCSHRCCMCGLKGHSGIRCTFKRCPCGEKHLTQDCRWKVECAIKGCFYYLCRIHCRECGKEKAEGPENAFVGRTCQACLKNGIPVSARAP
jgi:hypothetical protein